MTETVGTDSEVLLRLDVISKLLLRAASPPSEGLPIRNQIVLLAQMGLSNKQITAVVGKPSNYVSATLAQHKGAKKR